MYSTSFQFGSRTCSAGFNSSLVPIPEALGARELRTSLETQPTIRIRRGSRALPDLERFDPDRVWPREAKAQGASQIRAGLVPRPRVGSGDETKPELTFADIDICTNTEICTVDYNSMQLEMKKINVFSFSSVSALNLSCLSSSVDPLT